MLVFITLKSNSWYVDIKFRYIEIHIKFLTLISTLLKTKIATREEIFTIIYIDKHVNAFLNISSGLESSSKVDITLVSASSTSLSSYPRDSITI